jgi:hypothetical protein
VTERLDAVTYVHWLYWRLKVLECGHMEFQRLFEDIMARAGDAFVRVKPHGKLGDKKCDGLYYGEGVVYQVYSPDRVERTKTLAKIKEDLAGAVAEWGEDLKEWVFVYNTRAGVAADVPALLKAQQRIYKKVKIRPLSDDDLWKNIVRPMSAQDRTEILGPPPGFEDFFPTSAMMPAEVQERLRNGRFVVIQDTMSPVNIQQALEAIQPARPLGPPLYLRRKPEDLAWELAAEHQRHLVEQALELSREHLPRFATFGFTPIPLAVHLGYLLSDRVEVSPFQWHRERKTWAWDETVTRGDTDILLHGVPDQVVRDARDVVLRVSLSRTVTPEQTASVAPGAVEVDVSVREPHEVSWLVHPDQITAFQSKFREALKLISERVPNCPRIHLCAAVPMGCAVAAGQAINPRMNPPVQLYQFDVRKQPPYEPVLLLS